MPSSFRFDYAVDPTSSAPCGAHFSMEISMQKQPECCHEDLSVRGGLEEAVRLLAGELRAVRADVLRERRRVRGLAVVLAGVLVVTGWSVLPSLSIAEAQSAASHQARPMSPEERANRRAELISMLPADKQRELVTFEQEVEWLSGYMQTWDEGKAGAVVAMMLFRMARSMDTMPSMDQQMRTMSGQMGSLPAIVAELNAINAKMHVITAAMDSTMGRTGRMMPWMPFSP